MSFVESILVPLETYQKRISGDGDRKIDALPSQIATSGAPSGYSSSPATSILTRPTNQDMPSDLKMKLYHQARWEEKQQLSNTKTQHELLNKMTIGAAHNSFMGKILENFVDRNKQIVSWQPETYEIILNGKLYPNTNIVRSLEFLLKPEQVNAVVPPGADKLRSALIGLGVPEGWMNMQSKNNVTDIHDNHPTNRGQSSEDTVTRDTQPTIEASSMRDDQNITVHPPSKKIWTTRRGKRKTSLNEGQTELIASPPISARTRQKTMATGAKKSKENQEHDIPWLILGRKNGRFGEEKFATPGRSTKRVATSPMYQESTSLEPIAGLTRSAPVKLFPRASLRDDTHNWLRNGSFASGHAAETPWTGRKITKRWLPTTY